jgi:hypothetical protein
MEVMHRACADNVMRIAAEITRLTRSGGLLYVESPAYVAHKPQSYTEPGPGTYVPAGGDEQSVPHHYFKKEDPSPSSPASTRLTLSVKCGYNYCLTARRR